MQGAIEDMTPTTEYLSIKNNKLLWKNATNAKLEKNSRDEEAGNRIVKAHTVKPLYNKVCRDDKLVYDS